MPDDLKDICTEDTENLTVELPCRIFERVQRYAKENGTDVSGVLIEALDQFLRGQDRPGR